MDKKKSCWGIIFLGGQIIFSGALLTGLILNTSSVYQEYSMVGAAYAAQQSQPTSQPSSQPTSQPAVHYEDSTEHYENTDRHFESTVTHYVGTNVHGLDTSIHSGSTRRHSTDTTVTEHTPSSIYIFIPPMEPGPAQPEDEGWY